MILVYTQHVFQYKVQFISNFIQTLILGQNIKFRKKNKHAQKIHRNKADYLLLFHTLQ